MEKIKFVMTDTDTQVSAVCSRALEAKGIAVTVCEKNGTKALETLLAVHPQAVLLDAFMPDLDAITVKQRYEARTPAAPTRRSSSRGHSRARRWSRNYLTVDSRSSSSSRLTSRSSSAVC